MVKRIGNIKSNGDKLKIIPIHNLFYIIALDMVGPLPETKNGNKYILVAIDHYSKWCETKTEPDHVVAIVAKILKDEIIC
jgi:ribosomal protein S19